jgi:hypothetical protein
MHEIKRLMVTYKDGEIEIMGNRLGLKRSWRDLSCAEQTR